MVTADVKGTVFGEQFTKLEGLVKAAGVPFTFLRLPIFIDNNWGNLQTIKEQGKIYASGTPNGKFSPVAVQDIADSAAAILSNPAAAGTHAGKTYILTAPTTTNAEIAKAFSTALGKQVDYIQVPKEAAKQAIVGLGLQAWQADGILQLYDLFDQNSPITNNPTNDIQTLTGRAATSVEQWVTAVAPAFK